MLNDTKIAVMQPYLFPYLGYFQLINAVDVFVFYDDVNFIKQGWINRNRIIGSNEPIIFTVPLAQASSFKKISETEINQSLFENWRKKFLKTLEQTYSKAPFFNKIFQIVSNTLNTEHKYISNLAITSVKSVCQYLDLNIEYKVSSDNFAETEGLERTERLFAICKALQAKHYINSLGGLELYSKNEFTNSGINLSFLKTNLKPYSQFSDKEFIPGLSMIDVMMFNDKETINMLLKDYELI